MRASSLLLLIVLLTSYSYCAAFFGNSFPYLDQSLFRNGGFFEAVMNFTGSFPHTKSGKPRRQPHAYAPTSSITPRRRKHRHGHHHRAFPVVIAPAPSEQGCNQICEEPYTSSPFGSPCGCVLPMKVRLLLHVAPYAIFPVMNELESEVASGTYLEQSQVKIMGATADGLNQDRTLVDIDLVPLGEKFDNTTALLTYQRLQHKKVPLNSTLFGAYEVLYAIYPGLPLLYNGTGPSSRSGDLPITANFGGEVSQKLNPRTIAIISLAGFVLLLLVVVAVVILMRWRRFGRPSSAVGPAVSSSVNKRSGLNSFLSTSIASSTPVSIMSPMPSCMLSVKTFGYLELEKATNKFSSSMLLGEGGFGKVYRGVIEKNQEVAVKLLNRHQNGDREFVAEVEMLSRLHHRNLVKLIGICVEGCTRCLVYELVRNGSVESHLHGVDKETGPLDWDARLKIALGAGRGLAYLHEDSNPRVIHRDFKASNVLLEDDFTPKVSDFGLAREATEGTEHISTRVMGTFGYVAPEYAMTGHLLVKSDVYSYGVMLLELLSGRKPVDMKQERGQENLVTWARPLLGSREGISEVADPWLRGRYDVEDMERVAAIAAMCVEQDVSRRPFMGEVVQALKLICHDADDTCSPKESSALESDVKAPSDTSWWNAGGISPRLRYTMEYSSDDVANRLSLPIRHGNRSGPLTTIRCKTRFYRLRATRSDLGAFSSLQSHCTDPSP